ncbi:MAG: helix-turn-helix domain-containing protein [Lachnospiraceae bacterium]|nr:helix-turn-helix domain-containing protein [Lachnospiraceae bacterium]
MVDRIKIGDFLRTLRNEKGLTQEEVAEKFGVSSRSVSRWENGNTMPELGILVEIAVFYGVDIKEIIDGERKSENMENEVIETLEKAADYAREEKKHAFKKKTLFIWLSTAAVAVAVILLIWFVRTVPVRNLTSDEAVLKAIYRIETEEGYKYFMRFDHPIYSGRVQTDFSIEDGPVLAVNIKRPLWSSVISDFIENNDILVYECGRENGSNGGRLFKEFDSVTFAGNTVWTKDSNQDNTIPEYVALYEEWFTGGIGDISSWDIYDDSLEANYDDGSCVRWDFAGNVIYDTRNNGQ